MDREVFTEQPGTKNQLSKEENTILPHYSNSQSCNFIKGLLLNVLPLEWEWLCWNLTSTKKEQVKLWR